MTRLHPQKSLVNAEGFGSRRACSPRDRLHAASRLAGYLTRSVAICMFTAFVSTGCVSSMKNGDLAAIQPASQAPRVGQVYLIRGLIGLFSVGIDNLTNEINAAGISAHVYQEIQDPAMARAMITAYKATPHATDAREPLILIGHSVGAEDVITIARKLEKEQIEVDLMICLDATNPDKVPANVRRCINYYQSSIMDHLPILRGLPLKTESAFAGDLQNLNVRKDRRDLLEWDTNHFNIDKDGKIHADILARLKDVCTPRAEWIASRSTATTKISISK